MSSPPTMKQPCNRPEGLFLDMRPWQSQALGQRFITSRRIGIPDQAGQTRYIINVVDDVTDRRRADEKIAHLAHYDALTDLPNRVLFRERIERELQRTSRGEQFALLYIDVDEFKGINDSLGHHVGDELLKAVAARIRDCIRECRSCRPARRRRIRGDPDRCRTFRRRHRIRDAHSRCDPATL